jgi:hypothetical protein
MRQERELDRQPIEDRILLIRGQKVILDSDLAVLYGVEVRALNQAVKRNKERFPEDFVFQLNEGERVNLRSQIVTSSSGHGGRRYPPCAFTEHGAIMAASVLNSSRAVEMSLFVVRAFVRLREMLGTHKQLASKLAELERRLETHDQTIQQIIEAIKQLMAPPARSAKRIGFRPDRPGKAKALNPGPL